MLSGPTRSQLDFLKPPLEQPTGTPRPQNSQQKNRDTTGNRHQPRLVRPIPDPEEAPRVSARAAEAYGPAIVRWLNSRPAPVDFLLAMRRMGAENTAGPLVTARLLGLHVEQPGHVIRAP